MSSTHKRLCHRRTNDYVIERVGKPQCLLDKTAAAQQSYFCHIRRRDDTSLENTVLTGSVEGSRGQESPRITWAKTLMAAKKKSMHEIRDMALDRISWRCFVIKITSGRKPAE